MASRPTTFPTYQGAYFRFPSQKIGVISLLFAHWVERAQNDINRATPVVSDSRVTPHRRPRAAVCSAKIRRITLVSAGASQEVLKRQPAHRMYCVPPPGATADASSSARATKASHFARAARSRPAEAQPRGSSYAQPPARPAAAAAARAPRPHSRSKPCRCPPPACASARSRS